MRKWFKKRTINIEEDNIPAELSLDTEGNQPSSWQRLKKSLVKTRQTLSSSLMRFFKKDQILDDEYWEELESVLLIADFGLKTSTAIIDYLKTMARQRQELDGESIKAHLSEYLLGLLKPIAKPFELKEGGNPQVILVVGVNGVGKTTSLAKLAYFLKTKAKVMMAAGDTFRAAAIEQLQFWGERQQIPVVAQGIGSDSAAVIFDALQAAQARGIDVLLADTAGRLHNQVHLLQELQKIKRVLAKLDSNAPHDVLMVLDASIGQNALQQVRQFHDALGLSGLIVSKLDGTAKGGILFAIASEFKIPCYFIGIGEGLDDLRPFDPEAYVQAILS